MINIGSLTLNGEAFLTHLFRASIEGAILILVLWAVSRRFRKLPPSLTHLLWWLACLKLILGLVIAPQFSLPLLPVSAIPSPASALSMPHPAPDRRTPDPLATRTIPVTPAEPLSRTIDASSRGVRSAPAGPTRPMVSAWAIRWQDGLLLLWAIGVGLGYFRLVREYRSLRRLTQEAHPVEDCEIARTALSLAEVYGVRPPHLRQSSDISGPLVCGLFRPRLLLPTNATEEFTQEELRMALAHELAHLKRRDLLLAWVPVHARILFFFHPLAYVAAREWSEAAEAACDADSLRVTGSNPADYGKFLLKLSHRPPLPQPVPAMGASAGYRSLQRRLRQLRRSSSPSARTLKMAGVALIVLGSIVLLPWRLTAQEGDSTFLSGDISMTEGRPYQQAQLIGSWKPDVAIPPPPPVTLPDDPRLDKPVSIEIAGEPLEQVLARLSEKIGVPLTVDDEVKHLKVIAYLNEAPANQALRNLATLFRLTWEETSGPVAGYRLSGGKEYLANLQRLDQAERDYFYHRLSTWYEGMGMPSQEFKEFDAKHPEVWGSAFGTSGGNLRLLRLLKPEHLKAVASGKPVYVTEADMAPADTVELKELRKQVEGKTLVAHMESDSSLISASSQIIVEPLVERYEDGRPRIAVGAKLTTQDSPVFATLYSRPEEMFALGIPPVLARQLKGKPIRVPHDEEGSVHLPELLIEIGRVSGQSILSDYHYSRGVAHKENFKGKSALEVAERMCDTWRLISPRSTRDVVLLRDVEWWVYDRVDLPEREIEELRKAATGGTLPEPVLQQLMSRTAPQQFDLLLQWRLRELYNLRGSHRNRGVFAHLVGPEPRKGVEVTFTPPNRVERPSKRAVDPAIAQACEARLQRIGQALAAYRRDHQGDLPDRLSELLPRYLTDAKLFLCEAGPRSEPGGSGQEVLDPNLLTSYLYEFNEGRVGGGFLQLGPKQLKPEATWKEGKTAQTEYFGDLVPVVRCRHHSPMLSLALSGEIFKSEAAWELDPRMIPTVLENMARAVDAGPERFLRRWSPEHLSEYLGHMVKQPGPEIIAPEELSSLYHTAAVKLERQVAAFPEAERPMVYQLLATLYLYSGDDERASDALAKTPPPTGKGPDMISRVILVGQDKPQPPKDPFNRGGGGMSIGSVGRGQWKCEIHGSELGMFLRHFTRRGIGPIIDRPARLFVLDRSLAMNNIGELTITVSSEDELIEAVAHAAGGKVERNGNIYRITPNHLPKQSKS